MSIIESVKAAIAPTPLSELEWAVARAKVTHGDAQSAHRKATAALEQVRATGANSEDAVERVADTAARLEQERANVAALKQRLASLEQTEGLPGALAAPEPAGPPRHRCEPGLELCETTGRCMRHGPDGTPLFDQARRVRGVFPPTPDRPKSDIDGAKRAIALSQRAVDEAERVHLSAGRMLAGIVEEFRAQPTEPLALRKLVAEQTMANAAARLEAARATLAEHARAVQQAEYELALADAERFYERQTPAWDKLAQLHVEAARIVAEIERIERSQGPLVHRATALARGLGIEAPTLHEAWASGNRVIGSQRIGEALRGAGLKDVSSWLKVVW